MTKENKDYGKSVKAKLLNLSKAEGLAYQPLLIRYVQERLLYRLAQSRYKHRFYLKGGALLYAHEQFKARPTLDIDFLGNSIANDKKIIEEAFSEICGISCEKDGIHFDTATIKTEEINENRVYKGIRLHVTARLDTARQKLPYHDFPYQKKELTQIVHIRLRMAEIIIQRIQFIMKRKCE